MTDSRGSSDRGSDAPESRSQWLAEQQPGSEGVGRAAGLTTLSALLPGAGLLGTPRRRLGAVLVGLAVLTVVVVGGYALTNGLTTTALQTAADTGRLRAIAVLLVLGTLVWIAAIALTALSAAPRRPTTGQRTALSALTAVLCLAVTAPALLGVRYIDAHVDAVDKVFDTGGTVGGGSSEATPTSVIGSDPDDPWKDLPRVNVLLLGSDAAEAREGTRTDTMIVASIDTRTGDSVLFSIPRNLQNIPIPRDNPLHEVYGPVYDCGDQCLMNSIWTEAEAAAEEHPEWYADDPNPGQTATREVLSGILGIPIHHTVIVNMKGFADLVDAMGGVLVNVQERIPIGGVTYTDANGTLQLDPNSDYEWLEPGSQRLDGPQALAYSRSRVTSDDFSRMRRQRCMVAAVVDQVNPMTMLQRYPPDHQRGGRQRAHRPAPGRPRRVGGARPRGAGRHDEQPAVHRRQHRHGGPRLLPDPLPRLRGPQPPAPGPRAPLRRRPAPPLPPSPTTPRRRRSRPATTRRPPPRSPPTSSRTSGPSATEQAARRPHPRSRTPCPGASPWECGRPPSQAGDGGLRGRSWNGLPQTGRTVSACGPLGLCVTSNSTRWASSSVR
ncbi:LCP family protein [Serinicoccus profundi]|uniref:LCP family glycopolymer transferase n=1 Tax=Serinicoccus profundi TaxID=1078471 RepID=UPI0011CB7972|nr:LCP family protein [Serinicoccus profundi]